MPIDDASARRREIGRRVAHWRARRRVTRQQFADLCERSLSWVDKVESGERGLLRLPMLERVAEVLHVSVDTLTGTTETEIPQDLHCLDAFEISAIRTALQSYQAISQVFVPTDAISEPPNLDRVDQQVDYAWAAFQNAHWPGLGRALPGLLTTGQTAVSACSGGDDQARHARILLSQAYQVTASALWKLSEADLAWLAAERALVLAEETGDNLLISDAARRVAQGLMVLGHHGQAPELLRADIDRLEPSRGTDCAAHLSLYGMLFLMGAVVAARADDGALARDLLDEGHGVARQLGRDCNERFTAFGPTNVRLHQLAVLLDLGDGSGAVKVARRITADGLNRLPKERRANYYLDLARGHVLSGGRDDAVSVLLQADVLFPDEVRCRPGAIELIHSLRRSSSGSRASELDRLATRVGLAARE